LLIGKTSGAITREKKWCNKNLWWMMVEMGRISVELSDELEKKLRFKTIERFGGRKGDLSKAVEEAVKTWVAEEK
jgi:hypothetical protein